MPTTALTPFFTEMRRELAQTASDFEGWIGTLSTAAADDPLLMVGSFLTDQRIGQTANWSASRFECMVHPSAGYCRMLSCSGDARRKLSICQPGHRSWMNICRTSEFASSLALVKYLSSGCFPQPLDESSASLVGSLTTSL